MKHTSIYFDSLGKYKEDPTNCEVCGHKAVDIHHIEARGMGGTTDKSKNSIFNLMALCRNCHEKYGDKTHYKKELKLIHFRHLIQLAIRQMGIYREVNFREDKIEIKNQ